MLSPTRPVRAALTPETGSTFPGRSPAADVTTAFDEGAPRYDLMVRLNPGYHRHLRDAARALLERLPTHRSVRLADLGCGSGASTEALVRSLDAERRDFALVGVDASAPMLDQARSKRWPRTVSFVHGRAEDLDRRGDEWGLAGPLDGVFASYLFRNVPDRDVVLRDVHDLIAPGGVLVTQEYSVAGSRGAVAVWTAVCWLVVIPLARLTSADTSLYRYLWRSVRAFDSVGTFTDRLHRAGFVDVEVRTVPGWQRGILHTFRAHRPHHPDAVEETR